MKHTILGLSLDYSCLKAGVSIYRETPAKTNNDIFERELTSKNKMNVNLVIILDQILQIKEWKK